MKQPHKHAELIKAWADGAEIEIYEINHDQWIPCVCPSWIEGCKYRIKPEPKPDVVYYGVFEMNGAMVLQSFFTKLNDKRDEIKLIFDGETGKLKSAEVLK